MLTLTIEPELLPYSAENVELSILNSDVVLIDGWNVIWFWLISFRLMPLIWKFTESSRLPAVMNEFAPKPAAGRRQAARSRSHNATRRQHRQIEEVAPIQRNILHRLAVDHLSDRHALRLHLRRAALHIDTVSPAAVTESFALIVTRWSTSSVNFCTVYRLKPAAVTCTV